MQILDVVFMGCSCPGESPGDQACLLFHSVSDVVRDHVPHDDLHQLCQTRAPLPVAEDVLEGAKEALQVVVGVAPQISNVHSPKLCPMLRYLFPVLLVVRGDPWQ